MPRNRPRLMICVFIAFMVIVSACGETLTSPKDERPQVALDLGTLEAETAFGTLRAQRAERSFVGLVGEGRVISIAFLDELSAGDTQERQGEIIVYLYERRCLAVMIEEVDGEGFARLESSELSEFEATVELVITDEVVTGTVTFLGEASVPFTAAAAAGITGVYWAHGTDEHPEVSGEWVVLADERQWGCVCLPPFTSPCCLLRTL